MKITKTNLLLFLILILAIVLRIIVASNLELTPDEMVYSLFPLNIIEAGRLSTIEQAPVFFYLTDLGYQTFGFSPIIARLPSIIFGSFAVLVIFLIAQEIFYNKKVGLFSAFFLAISGYSIQYNLEMDITAFFFLLLSIYYFIRFLKGKVNNIYFSAIFLGIAVITKPLVAFLALAYPLFYFIYFRKKGKALFNKKIVKAILIAILLFILTLTPVLTYNYLLYKEKGITDFYFSTFSGVGDNIYQGLGGQKPWVWERFLNTSQYKLLTFIKSDSILLILGLLGFLFAFRKKNYWSYFFILAIVPPWIYLAGKTGSDSHYVIFLMVLALFAGLAFSLLIKKTKKMLKMKHLVSFLLIIFLIVNVFLIRGVLTERNTMVNLREFAETVPDEAIVIVDPLIYTGISAWTFSDKHYLSGSTFPAFLEQLNNLSEPKVRVPFYYIECGRNSYCGWNPTDYQRVFNFSEGLTNYFKNSFTFVKEIKGSDVLVFPVYRGEIEIVPELYEAIDRTHNFYFYPVGWKYTEEVIDNYTPKTVMDKLLNQFSFIVLYVEILIAFFSLFLVVYLLWKRSY